MTASQLDEISQLHDLRRHLDELNDDLEEHCMLDKKIEVKASLFGFNERNIRYQSPSF
jgi:predicted component of type VI protein secretion system